jgi:hypothetical protein
MTSDLLTALVVFLCVGCGSSLFDSEPHPRRPMYSIGFANRTKELFSGVEAEWLINGVQYAPGAGMLGPGSEKEYEYAADPIPPAATVVWKTPDGKEHRQKMEVPKNIRDDAFWTGTVWFKFTDKGVEVVPLSNEQMHKLAQAQKEYP